MKRESAGEGVHQGEEAGDDRQRRAGVGGIDQVDLAESGDALQEFPTERDADDTGTERHAERARVAPGLATLARSPQQHDHRRHGHEQAGGEVAEVAGGVSRLREEREGEEGERAEGAQG